MYEQNCKYASNKHVNTYNGSRTEIIINRQTGRKVTRQIVPDASAQVAGQVCKKIARYVASQLARWIDN